MMVTTTPVPPTYRREEIIKALQKLLDHSRKSEHNAYQLFLYAQDGFHKELAISLWQHHVRHVTELNANIKRYGGDFSAEIPYASIAGMPSETERRRHIRRAIDEHGETLHAYEDTLKREWPVDIRSVLQRHQMRCKDILHRLEKSFLTTPRAA